MRLRLLPSCSLLLTLALLAGCGADGGGAGDAGGGSGDASGLRSGFAAAVDRARADGVDQGGGPAPCFVLDDEAVDRVSGALGLDPSSALDDPGYLSGEEGAELLQCSYEISSQDEAPPIGLVVALTDQDLPDYVDLVLGRDDPPEQLDGDSEGLGQADVTGFAEDGFQQVVWVEGGVRVQLGAREQDVDADTLFEALPVVIDEMERVLGST